MKFNDHSKLNGLHSFLSPSKYHWINYDTDKLLATWQKHRAAEEGTKLHDFARRCIDLGQKLPRTSKTLNMYVNDAIGYRMEPEVVLYFSPVAFGTADAISFKKNTLRIHDLKTGTTPTNIKQLYVYAALFCLEYDVRPGEIETHLRIYQNDAIVEELADSAYIGHVMDKITTFSDYILGLEEGD